MSIKLEIIEVIELGLQFYEQEMNKVKIELLNKQDPIKKIELKLRENYLTGSIDATESIITTLKEE